MARELTEHRTEREVVRDDQRWLLITVVVFLVSTGLLTIGYHIYDATGPHPQVTVFLRTLKRYAHWLLPDLKRP